jgi:hypothetical protein
MPTDTRVRKIVDQVSQRSLGRRADPYPCPPATRDYESPQSVARRISDDLSALTASEADFPFALGRLVAEIVGDRGRMSPADARVRWNEGRNLVTCILSHLACSPHEVKPADRLPKLRSLLLRPQRMIRAELTRIVGESLSVLARVIALDLMNCESADEFEAICSAAIDQTQWLFSSQ